MSIWGFIENVAERLEISNSYLSLQPPKDFRKLLENEYKLNANEFDKHIRVLQAQASGAQSNESRHASELLDRFNLTKNLVSELLDSREFLVPRLIDSFAREHGSKCLDSISQRLVIMAKTHENKVEAEEFSKLADLVDSIKIKHS